MDMMQSGTWLSLSQYALLLVLSIASSLIICFALHLLWLLKKQRNFECSPSLLVYLASLLLCCLALFVQYGILLLFQLLPSSLPQISPTQLIFWSGLFPGSLIPATPISVLFLSLDRLLIVLLPSVYMRKLTKFGLAAASSVAIFGLFSLNFGVNLAQRPVKEVPECISFGCLTSDASRLIYAVNRLVVALPNFLIGSAFLFVLFAYRRRMEKNAGPAQNNANRSRKMGDRLALWVVIFEFGLDLLPNLVNFALTSFSINISVYVGAFRSLSYSFCAICSAFAHTAVLWRIFATKAPNVKSIIQTGAMTKAQFRSGEDGEKSKRFSEQTQTRSFGGGRSTNSGKQMAVIEGSRRNRITFENQ